MRVIAGSARGVPLATVPDLDTRPILDRVKKSFFSILDSAGLLVQARVLDLYAGTGTLGVEALSRGAAGCLFVERRADAVALLRQNLARTRLAERAEVRCGDVSGAVQALLRLVALSADSAIRCGPLSADSGTRPTVFQPFDLIFHDPPFVFSREAATRPALEAELAAAGELLSPAGCLVLRAEAKTTPPVPRGLVLFRHWQDGPHGLCFYAPVAGTQAG